MAGKNANQNLADHFGDITLSLDELNEAARHTLGEGLFNSIDESDQSAYMQTVDDYVKNAQEYVSNKGYVLKLAPSKKRCKAP